MHPVTVEVIEAISIVLEELKIS